MKKKVHILFFLLTFGFFLMSNSGYACGKSSEKTSCEKKAVSKKENSHSCQEDCCKKGHDSKDQHGCSGKCDHSSCTTTALQFSLITTNEFEFENNLFNFSSEKSVSYYKTASISDGFTSIWLIPKIK
ncbi:MULTISPECIES: hypothetical protein [Flavobacterium]|uniref:hypothetical protein n=1 Tax=Flavobacterium TaxID=237 RepID=UPI0021158C6F|nr:MULTISPECIES: hypothetical protein [Flavobacterium]UUF14736.1 hypothetical protein NLJ00_01205 [Flavobacterium panici]